MIVRLRTAETYSRREVSTPNVGAKTDCLISLACSPEVRDSLLKSRSRNGLEWDAHVEVKLERSAFSGTAVNVASDKSTLSRLRPCCVASFKRAA